MMSYAAPQQTNRSNMTMNNPQAQSMMRNQTAAFDATVMAQNNVTANTGNFGGQTIMMQQPVGK